MNPNNSHTRNPGQGCSQWSELHNGTRSRAVMPNENGRMGHPNENGRMGPPNENGLMGHPNGNGRMGPPNGNGRMGPPNENGGMWPQGPFRVPNYPPIQPVNMVPSWSGMRRPRGPIEYVLRDPEAYHSQMQKMNSTSPYHRGYNPLALAPQRPPQGQHQTYAHQRPPQGQHQTYAHQGQPQTCAPQRPHQTDAPPSSSRYSAPSVAPVKYPIKTRPENKVNANKAGKMKSPTINMVHDLNSSRTNTNDYIPQQFKPEMAKPDSIQRKVANEPLLQSRTTKFACDNASEVLSDFKDMSMKSNDLKDVKIDIPDASKNLFKEGETPKVANSMPPAAVQNVNNLTHKADDDNIWSTCHGLLRPPMRFANRWKAIPTSIMEANRLKVPKFTDLKVKKSIQQIIASKEQVFITHFYCFDKIHIVTAKAYDWDMKLMREDILEVTESDESERKMFDFTPDVGSVILAPYKRGKQEYFLRAVVEEVVKQEYFLRAVVEEVKDPILVVRFFDQGSRRRVLRSATYKITDELMEVVIPILGLEVSLQDIDASKTDMILMSDYNDFTTNWSETTPCQILSVDKINGKEVINLKCEEFKDCKTLSERIINLGRWQWQEKWERSHGMTEERLCDTALWKVDERHIRKLKKGELTKVTVAYRVPDSALIHVLFNVEESYIRDREVLQRQIELFMKCMGPDVFYFPAVGEYVLAKILPNDDPLLKNVKGLGRWNRCMRDGIYLLNVDELEIYPIANEYRDVVKIRQYCANFGKVPYFSFTARLTGCAPLDAKKEATIQEVIQKGSVITISTLNPDANQVEIKCKEFLDRLAELEE